MTKIRLARYAALISAALLLSLWLGAYSNLMRYRFGILEVTEPLSWKMVVALASTYDAGLMVLHSLAVPFDNTPIRPQSPLRDVRLRLEASAIKKMASNLPESAKARYYSGEMQYPDGTWQTISFRFRGRNIWHWQPDKPSLRLKLRRSLPLDLQRHINLVNPEDLTMIANYYGELLGRRLGVLTHKTSMVRVFINNAYFGVYQMTTRDDENMLRVNRRMPGPIYIGDGLSRVWREEQFEKKGDLKVLDDFDPMARVIEAIYADPSPARYDKLWDNMDMEKLARWTALMNLSGGIHTDYTHNHAYYFDPSTGKLEPLVSDILALGTLLYPGARDRLTNPYEPDHTLPLNEKLQPLLDAALRDPYFYDLRNRVLYEALKGVASTDAQHALLGGIYQMIDQDVKADRRKAFVMETFSGFFRMPYANWFYEEGKAEAFEWVAKRNAYLMAELEKSDVSIRLAGDPAGDTLARVSVGGHAAARVDLANFPPGAIAIDRNLNGEYLPISTSGMRLFPGLKEDHEFFYEQVKDRRVPAPFLMPDVQHYLFRFAGMPPARVQELLAGAFSNAITGSDITPAFSNATNVDVSEIAYNAVSLHAWRFAERETTDIVLGPGVVEMRSSVQSNDGQAVIVMPGTTLKLAPGVSIFSKGRLMMIGDTDAPIKVERLDPGKPWGVIAAQGSGSSGSRIVNADIAGGSIDTAFNINYSGMVSFLWSNDIVIESTNIHGNVSGDDSLRIVHGDAVLRNVGLSDCFSDCIDFDYADVELIDVSVRNAGNDGFDFMTSRARITGGTIDRVGDKGVSGGEGSNIELVDIRISNAETGIAAKDKSVVKLRDSSLFNNIVAIDVFKKNWRYGGAGRVQIQNTEWSGNAIDIRVQDGGDAVVVDGPKPYNLLEDQGTITVN